MTDDTRLALEIVRPMAKEFGIAVDADEKLLYVKDPYMGDIEIGISCNSTYATLKEFIGVMIYRYDRDRDLGLSKKQDDIIRRYWRENHDR